jgi:hypothetical protein
MKVRNWNALVWLFLVAAGALTGACRKVYTYAVVPRPDNGRYRPDTLRAYQNGNLVQVIFRFDTVTHTRTVYRTDTLWKEGTRIIRDTVRVVRRDTIRLRDTIRVVRRDTIRVPAGTNIGINQLRVDTVIVRRVDTVRVSTPQSIGMNVLRVDTVRRVDTLRLPIQVFRDRVDTVRLRDTVYMPLPGSSPQPPQQRRVDTLRITVRDTLRIVVRDTLRIVVRDTLRLTRVDTVRVVRADTVRITRTDTVRVATGGGNSGGRKLFVPPGHYPPLGQCRVWIDGMPPGRQADPAPCDRLGAIPAGAFILYGGVAWDYSFDWAAAGDGSAPPQIIALKRRP